MNVKKILAVINATYAVAKRKPEKIRLAGIPASLIFSGFLFATAYVALITARIFFTFISCETVVKFVRSTHGRQNKHFLKLYIHDDEQACLNKVKIRKY